MLKFTFLALLLCYLQANAPTEYNLINNMTYPTVNATKVTSSSQLFICSSQKLFIYSLISGLQTNLVDFSSVATGSNLICLDAYKNNTFCLFSKGTFMIRYNVSSKDRVIHDFNQTGNTAGKLMLGGNFGVVNAPSVAKIYILNFTTMTGIGFKPVSTASTAVYMFEVNTKGNEVVVYASKYMNVYAYSTITYDWLNVYSVVLSPIVGSSIYWVSFSPVGDVFYNTRGGKIIQTRSTLNYTVLIERNYAIYTTIAVSNLQFTSTVGNQVSIQLYNSTSNTSFIEILNVTSNTSKYMNISDNKTTSFQSMKVYPIEKIMVLFYDAYGCEVYQLKCLNGSIYSDAQGLCLYCNETTLCNPPVNQTSNSTTNNTSSNSNVINNATNGTSNGTNLSFNSSNLNQTLNSTNSTNLTYSNQMLSKQKKQSSMQEQIVYISGRFYSIPTIRQSLKSFSYFFLAMDGIWMYQYHNRTYGDDVQNIFESVHKVQDLKFSFFSLIGNAYELLTDTQSQIKNISKYIPYTNSNYLQVENKDGSFLSNSIDFIVFHIPGTIIIFILLRFLFFRVQKTKLHKFLKLYSFWGYSIVCLLQPNVQYFSYLLGNQFHLSFFFNFLNKSFALIWVNCLFFIIFFSVTLILFMKYLYGNNVKFFLENTRHKYSGIAWVVFSMALKRMFTGISHSYLYESPTKQLFCLISAQFTQLIIMFLLWKKLKLFPQQIGVWARIFINLIMIIFELILLLKGYVMQLMIISLLDEKVYEILMILFASTLVFCILALASQLIEYLIKNLKSKQQTQNMRRQELIKSWKIVFDFMQLQIGDGTQTSATCINSFHESSRFQKRNITVKSNTKFASSSRTISERDQQDDSRSVGFQQNSFKTKHHQNPFMKDVSQNQANTAKDMKSVVSIKNILEKENSAPNFTFKDSNTNIHSSASIQDTLREHRNQKPKIVSVKKINTTQILQDVKHKETLNRKVSAKSEISAKLIAPVGAFNLINQKNTPQIYYNESKNKFDHIGSPFG